MVGGSAKLLADAKSLEVFFLLLLLLVPGVIIDFVRALFVGRRTRTVGEAGLNFVVVSLLYYALMLPLIIWLVGGWGQLLDTIGAWYPLLFVGPVLTGVFLGWSAQTDFFGKNARRMGVTVVHPMPTAWDRRFSTLRESWVIITLKDGRTVAGLFGARSVASSDPENRDLFVEKIYDLNGDEWIDAGEKSALIMSGEISTIEFIAPEAEATKEAEFPNADSDQEADAGRGGHLDEDAAPQPGRGLLPDRD